MVLPPNQPPTHKPWEFGVKRFRRERPIYQACEAGLPKTGRIALTEKRCAIGVQPASPTRPPPTPDEQASIGREEQVEERATKTPFHKKLLLRGDIPETHRAVVAAARQCFAVRRKGDGKDG